MNRKRCHLVFKGRERPSHGEFFEIVLPLESSKSVSENALPENGESSHVRSGEWSRGHAVSPWEDAAHPHLKAVISSAFPRLLG